jgi:hypothetical protein
MADGEWLMANGGWRMADGEWLAAEEVLSRQPWLVRFW